MLYCISFFSFIPLVQYTPFNTILMPLIDSDNAAEMAWTKNATRLWGIPLHPLDKMSLFDFYMAASDELRARLDQLLGGKLQVVLSVAILLI